MGIVFHTEISFADNRHSNDGASERTDRIIQFGQMLAEHMFRRNSQAPSQEQMSQLINENRSLIDELNAMRRIHCQLQEQIDKLYEREVRVGTVSPPPTSGSPPPTSGWAPSVPYSLAQCSEEGCMSPAAIGSTLCPPHRSMKSGHGL